MPLSCCALFYLKTLCISFHLIRKGYMKRRIQDLIKESRYIKEENLGNKNKYFEFFEGYDGVILNNNIPYFQDNEITNVCSEKYFNLDNLGRCGQVTACTGRERLITKKRTYIGHIIPSGWHSVKYDCIKGKYLFNRCHILGHQLAGQDIKNNLITGTRYLNVSQMLPFENAIADYCKTTSKHVMYRVRPIYKYDDLVAHGILLQALSVEDGGGGVCFNIYLYNRQPGIDINYETGESNVTEKV